MKKNCSQHFFMLRSNTQKMSPGPKLSSLFWDIGKGYEKNWTNRFCNIPIWDGSIEQRKSMLKNVHYRAYSVNAKRVDLTQVNKSILFVRVIFCYMLTICCQKLLHFHFHSVFPVTIPLSVRYFNHCKWEFGKYHRFQFWIWSKLIEFKILPDTYHITNITKYQGKKCFQKI